MKRRRYGRHLSVLVMLAFLVACAPAETATTTTSQGQTTDPPTTTTIAATTTAAPTTTTTAPDSAPPELAGAWFTEVPPDRVTLSLVGTNYSISRGPATGSGKISVEGDMITFYDSLLCPGAGTYTWLIEDGNLIFTPVGDGEGCGGRGQVLIDVVYAR
jgi:hypothetical protein